MKKKIILAILLGIVWLCLAILFPYKNKSVKIKELNYATLFNDQNGVQLKAAAQFGIKQPLKNRDAAEDVKDGLVRIKDNSHYSIAKLTHSIPYLIDGAAELLDMIGKNFLDSLESKGLNPNKIIVTSVLRTQEDIKKLQKSGNPNAVKNSAHCYATTFDIAYAYYDKTWFKYFRFCESVDPETLKKVLGEVLRDLRKQKKCYVKYEVKQRCFHITTRM
ncbi:MAG: hypothetical protein IKJ10_08815 [Bacteroidaceae bacterium]|nr:hypothetical protein [Bacteroidaceae bacterium]